MVLFFKYNFMDNNAEKERIKIKDLLNSEESITLECLREFFHEHDFSTMPVKDPSGHTEDELELYNVVLKHINAKWKEISIVRINRELTSIHEEVLGNLNSIHGALLRMNRSIQSDGAFGEIKRNRSYTRARRRWIIRANF